MLVFARGAAMRRKFTEAEEAYVRAHWFGMTAQEMSRHLPGRTADAIHKFGLRIGLPKKGPVPRSRVYEDRDR